MSENTYTVPDADDFLLGGGVPSAKFPTIGTTVTGRITERPTVEQQRDFTTGDPKFWNDGKPMMQLVVTLATSERDPEVADDDGTRRIYVKAAMKKAVAEAVRRSGARGLEVGGVLAVTYTSDGEKTNPRFNAPKLYRAEYTPAAAAELNTPDPGVPAGVDPATGEITDPAAGSQALDPNDPRVKALLAQVQGNSAPAAPNSSPAPF